MSKIIKSKTRLNEENNSPKRMRGAVTPLRTPVELCYKDIKYTKGELLNEKENNKEITNIAQLKEKGLSCYSLILEWPSMEESKKVINHIQQTNLNPHRSVCTLRILSCNMSKKRKDSKRHKISINDSNKHISVMNLRSKNKSGYLSKMRIQNSKSSLNNDLIFNMHGKRK